MKIWSRATHFDWSQPDSKNKIYQGHEDGIIREWTFDRQAKKLVPGYEKWKMLDAIRDITSIPKYDLLLASCRVLLLYNFLFYRMVLLVSGTPKTMIFTIH